MIAWITSLRKYKSIHLLVVYTRYLIGGAFAFASIIKIKGERFISVDGTGYPVHSTPHFFETLYQSGLYWQFLGWSQLVAALLLMTQRFATIGAILFLGIITNIVVITLSYDFALTPLITVMILLATVLLLVWDLPCLRVLFGKPPIIIEKGLVDARIWQICGFLLFGFTLIYRLSVAQYNILFWAGMCAGIGLLTLLYWFFKSRAQSNCEP